MITLETRIMIYSSNYSKLCTFYQEILNFKTRESFDNGIMLETGSSIIEIFDSPDTLKTIIKLSLEVENVLEAWDKIQNAAKICHTLRFNSWGDTSFGILDPDENELIFFSKGSFI